MSILFGAMVVVLWVCIGLLVLWVGYLMLLTILAWFAPARTRLTNGKQSNRFVIMVPAHNEKELLPGLLQSLAKLTYPSSMYDVHVVADNCTDETAQLATEGGAIAHERFDAENRGKGYALQWLFKQIIDSGDAFDAALILDADSIVSPNFLDVMDAKLHQGATAIQAYYAVRDPERSWAVSLRAAALAVLHYLRPQGRTVLGVSAGLKGNGMVFHRSVLEKHQWSASVTEDIEYHMSLLLDGGKVDFAPDATVWAEIPTGLSDSNTQNERWEQGRMAMAKAYVPKLLAMAITPKPGVSLRQRLILIDGVMEHIIPPFSIVLGLNLFALVIAAFMALTKTLHGFNAALPWVLGLLFGQILYLLSGMILAKIPAQAYLAMLHLPKFLLWKIWLYAKLLLKPRNQGWVRTGRVGEQQ